MIPLLAFLFGLLIGSFLNVCIHRLPKGESVVRPRSRCPQCGHPIAWHENIPVLSWFFLGGRCRHCGGRISILYPAVELATAFLFGALAMRFGLTLVTVKLALFVSLMLILAFTDLTDRILPDEITLGGAAAGLVWSAIEPLPPGVVYLFVTLAGGSPSPRINSVEESLAGALVSAGLLFLVAEVYYRVRSREGMGMGDVKMMATIGAFLGLRYVFIVLMLASILGAVLGLIFILLFRKGLRYELPFGTFLAFAAILVALWQPQ